MTEQQYIKAIEYLLFHVKEMRQSQHMYFRNRNDTFLREAKKKESQVDEMIKFYERKGFDPTTAKPKTEQKKLF